ncbi:hypothetical protein [Streptomyces sviceus]|jgi:hypothetical protein|uniref:hypothetical protein n=1 Tax=Streptomyces sviceus TaxID=285530 RepID=UPI0036947FC5
MRVARTGAALTVATTAVLGLGLATAGPAAAAAGTWHAYGNTNPITSSTSTWRCASSHEVADDVHAQVCAIRSSGGGSVQAAVIVRNDRSSLYSAAAFMDLRTASTGLGNWSCGNSGVGAHSWSVCFGQTLTQSSAVNSAGSAEAVSLGVSPFV